MRHNAGDESEGKCLIGSDGIPPQGKLTGSSFPDPLDEEDKNNGGNKADVDFGIAERSMLLRCQDEIAHARETAPAGKRRTADDSDDRFAEFVDALVEMSEARGIGPVLFQIALRDTPEGVEVGPGAERRALPLEQR
jgi:hypothetical protein